MVYVVHAHINTKSTNPETCAYGNYCIINLIT